MYWEDKSFEKLTALDQGEYEHCRFSLCDFQQADFSSVIFSACEFIDCNLSLVKLNKTAIRDVLFKNCKMLGLQFGQCNSLGFSVKFEYATLNHSSFYKVRIKQTKFIHCVLQEVDFTEADLSGCLFDQCDLSRALFQDTILEKADLRSAFQYSIHPESNRIKKAKFSVHGLAGLLDRYDILIEY